VRDAKGNLVEDLKEGDFEVRDNGKPREIVGFQVETTGPTSGMSLQNASAPSSGQRAPKPNTSQAVYPRFIILAFDDWHLNATDMKMAKDAAAKIVTTSLRKTDYAAVVALSGRVNSGLTQDPAKLEQALASLQPNRSRTMNNNGCPTIDYYQAYMIVEEFDGAALEDLILQLMSCARMTRQAATDAANNFARIANDQGLADARASFANIETLIKAAGQLNGQRELILVSSGFFSDSPEALDAESQVIDAANQAAVTISALDARGVYVTQINASDNVQMRSPMVMQNLRAGSMNTAEYVMAELADGTGGTYFHRNNDLATGFERLAEVPDCVYLLELSLDGIKQNGAYHDLKVKVDRAGVDVQARKGYAAPNAKKKKK
jgi:VWFA-related protein